MMLWRWLIPLWFMTFSVLAAEPVTEVTGNTVRRVSSGDVITWSVSLALVLLVFFLCVGLFKKMGGISASMSTQMQVLGSLSLGVREKIVLVKVGNKQLIVGVTRGRIEKLHVLEGDDCLQDEPQSSPGDSFSQKLMQAMKGHMHEKK